MELKVQLEFHKFVVGIANPGINSTWLEIRKDRFDINLAHYGKAWANEQSASLHSTITKLQILKCRCPFQFSFINLRAASLFHSDASWYLFYSHHSYHKQFSRLKLEFNACWVEVSLLGFNGEHKLNAPEFNLQL